MTRNQSLSLHQDASFTPSRAAKQGHRIGRPRVTDREGFDTRYKTILERLRRGELSRRRAARELHIGYATLKRLLDGSSNNRASHGEA